MIWLITAIDDDIHYCSQQSESVNDQYVYGQYMRKKTRDIRIGVGSVFHPHTVVPAVASRAVSILDVSISISQLLCCYLI